MEKDYLELKIKDLIDIVEGGEEGLLGDEEKDFLRQWVLDFYEEITSEKL